MSNYPDVHVRQWLFTSGVTVKLFSSYYIFHFAVVGALAVSETVRLYWFPDERSCIDDRRPINDDASLVLFKEAWSGGLRPIVWAYTPIAGSGASSPAVCPLAVLAAPSTPVKRASTGTRDSRQQQEFRASLVARDGKNVCVACCQTCSTEAAHILRHGSSSSILSHAGLVSAWDVRNGIMLCSVCHLYFDKCLWCVKEGVIVVAGALLADDELSRHFAPLVGMRLSHDEGDINWPRELTWAHHRQLFEAAREARHAMQVDNAFVCHECGAMFKRHGSWKHHVESKDACDKRTRKGKRRLWTPLYRAAFPDVAAQDEAAKNEEAQDEAAQDEAALVDAARRLSLVDEEEEGDAGAVWGDEAGGSGGSSSS